MVEPPAFLAIMALLQQGARDDAFNLILTLAINGMSLLQTMTASLLPSSRYQDQNDRVDCALRDHRIGSAPGLKFTPSNV
jgi:hypothetical protein